MGLPIFEFALTNRSRGDWNKPLIISYVLRFHENQKESPAFGIREISSLSRMKGSMSEIRTLDKYQLVVQVNSPNSTKSKQAVWNPKKASRSSLTVRLLVFDCIGNMLVDVFIWHPHSGKGCNCPLPKKFLHNNLRIILFTQPFRYKMHQTHLKLQSPWGPTGYPDYGNRGKSMISCCLGVEIRIRPIFARFWLDQIGKSSVNMTNV